VWTLLAFPAGSVHSTSTVKTFSGTRVCHELASFGVSVIATVEVQRKFAPSMSSETSDALGAIIAGLTSVAVGSGAPVGVLAQPFSATRRTVTA
jgi:hypothetical protein